MFLISDFQDQGFESLLKVARRKHDLIPIVVTDPREMEIPSAGLVRLQDAETGETVVIDTSSRRNRQVYRQLCLEKNERRDAMFRRLKMSPIWLSTSEDIVEPLRRFFHAREK